jgi:predicted nuclease of predicted toxin-antitoxin system
MRFLLDHCVPNSVMRELESAGHTVEQLRAHIPVDSPDGLVIDKAQEIGAVLVSLNGDFTDITAYPPGNYRGIVAFQVKHRPEHVAAILRTFMAYLTQHPSPDDFDGNLLLVEVHRIRVRTS